jgi:hypothetical protein
MTLLRNKSRLALLSAALLLVANVVVPLVWGDVYPFTSAPMFRDAPAQCCNYRVLAPDGVALPSAEWLVERVYDGNPVGYGAGIRPPPVLEQQFGVVHDEAAVRRHVELQLAQPVNLRYPFVDVVQETIGPIDSQRVGIVRTKRWRIDRS